MQALNVLACWSEPRATSAIADIRGFIGMVLDRGHAYQRGAVYFDVSTVPGFGQVSHYSREEMLDLAAERGGNVDDPNKRDPLDFVLWQPSAEGEPAWESLWGPGVRAGTSSARRWRCASSTPRSTSTAAAPI